MAEVDDRELELHPECAQQGVLVDRPRLDQHRAQALARSLLLFERRGDLCPGENLGIDEPFAEPRAAPHHGHLLQAHGHHDRRSRSPRRR